MKVASDAIGAVASRRARSLTVIVRDEIERMIVSGDLEAGQRLNEQQLAVQLGVSRGPVREALRALERGGLVTGIANLGMFVRHLGIGEAIELYDLRGLIFAFCCVRVAERGTAEQKQQLTSLVEQMDQAIDGEGSSQYYQLNLDFHDRVMEFAGHRRATQVYQSLVQEAHLFRQRSLQPTLSMQESNAEHRRILEALIAGDAEAARRAGEEHHANGKARWLETLSR